MRAKLKERRASVRRLWRHHACAAHVLRMDDSPGRVAHPWRHALIWNTGRVVYPHAVDHRHRLPPVRPPAGIRRVLPADVVDVVVARPRGVDRRSRLRRLRRLHQVADESARAGAGQLRELRRGKRAERRSSGAMPPT
mgnify:CR=1 FL=1